MNALAALLLAARLVTAACEAPSDSERPEAVVRPGAWLDAPAPGPAPWSDGAARLLAPPNGMGSSAPWDPRFPTRKAATPEERALVAKGWTLVGPAQVYDDLRLVVATAGFDGMGRWAGYQAFVFVGGKLAGTLSPVPMVSRTDGALHRADVTGKDALVGWYHRYGPEDPLCCPSGESVLSFRVERKGLHGPRLVPVEPATTTQHPKMK